MTWCIGRPASRLIASAAAIVTFLACGNDREAARVPDTIHVATVPADSMRDARQEISLVQWMFRPSARERVTLDSLLQTIHARYHSNGKQLDGELYRFSTDTSADRYALVASIPRTSDQGVSPQLRFFVLGISPPRISSPSEIAIADSLDHFAVSKVEDYDSDGRADLAYCVWDGPRGAPGMSRGIGYRDSSWYPIATPTPPLPRCEPQAEP